MGRPPYTDTDPDVRAERTRQQNLRNAAKRQGFALTKTRRVDERAPDFGTWTLRDSAGRIVVHGKIEHVEEFLYDRPV
jgi:hypothetical protein